MDSMVVEVKKTRAVGQMEETENAARTDNHLLLFNLYIQQNDLPSFSSDLIYFLTIEIENKRLE